MLNVITGQLNEKASASDENMLPLVLDLDGTLIRTDLLVEGIVTAFFKRPLALIAALPLALVNRAKFKHRIAAIVDIDTDSLPVNSDLVAYAEREQQKGREIHLYTAASQSLAESVARRFGFFSSVVGSSETVNLKSNRKRDALVERFPGGFVYAGDAHADLSVWQASDAAVLVDTSTYVQRAVVASGKTVEATFTTVESPLKSWRKALRLHQWAKNLLVFVPLLLSHQYFDIPVVLECVAAFFIFSVSASGTYILNDLSDLSADRRHKIKYKRPFAAGKLNLLAGLSVSILLITGGLAVSTLISAGFCVALSAYLFVTLCYSFGLKKIPLLDVMILAILFTLRLVMGTEASDAGYSEWLLTFSMFFFLSLSMAKRFVEVDAKSDSPDGAISGRGYRRDDRSFISTMGQAAGVASILILVLFLRDDAFKVDIYHNKLFLWGIPVFMALFLGRLWLLATRKELNQDPVAFAVKDQISYLLGFGLMTCMLAAIFMPG